MAMLSRRSWDPVACKAHVFTVWLFPESAAAPRDPVQEEVSSCPGPAAPVASSQHQGAVTECCLSVPSAPTPGAPGCRVLPGGTEGEIGV